MPIVSVQEDLSLRQLKHADDKDESYDMAFRCPLADFVQSLKVAVDDVLLDDTFPRVLSLLVWCQRGAYFRLVPRNRKYVPGCFCFDV